MSKYDEERKRLGLKVSSPSSTTAVQDRPKSKYDEERKMLRGLILDTRPSPEDLKAQIARDEAQLAGEKQSYEQAITEPFITGETFLRAAPGTGIKAEDIISGKVDIPKNLSLEDKRSLVQRRGERREEESFKLPVVGPVLKGLDVAGEELDPLADFARSFYIPGGGAANTLGFYRSTGSALTKLAPGLGKTGAGRVAQKAIQEGVTGFPLATGQSLASGETDLREAAKQGLYGGAIGVGIGIGAGVRTALQKLIGRSKQPEAIQEILALPEPRQRGNISQVETPDVINIPETAPRGLPAPDLQPTVARRGIKEQNIYAQKLQRLFDEANNLEQQGKLTPGRELEEVEYLWSRMAEPNDPGLDELINLATRERTISPSALTRGRSAFAAGVGPNVRRAYEPFIGQAEAPVERVGYRRDQPKNVVDAEFTPVSKYAAERQAVQEVPQPISRYAAERETIAPTEGTKERGFVTTVKEAEKTAPEVAQGLRGRYTPVTNEESLRRANQRINNDIEAAASYVMGNTRTNAEKIATGTRLIDEFTKRGQHQRAVDIAEKLAEEGTKMGQSIQSFSMYERLSIEGILIHANRIARKTNEMISPRAKQVKVTEDMAAKVNDLVQTSKKLTGTKDLSNDVIDLVNRAKKGENLSELETDTIRRFVEEARQFAKETSRSSKTVPETAKIPAEMKNPRVRDNVISFLDAQEQAARERLRAKGFRVSSTPLDVYADYAIIGAAKLGKGVVKFTDWSESMIKDFGDEIKPMLNAIYERSKETLTATSKRINSQTISEAERITNRLIKSKDMTLEEAESLKKLALNVSGLSGDAKRIASQDLQKILQSLDRPTALQYVSSFQTIMQLLNPKTLVRNIGGNELFYRLERINKYVSTPIDWGRVKLFGGQRSVTFKTHSQGKYWESLMKGAAAGWKGVNPEGLTTQFDLRPATFENVPVMKYLEKALSASLRGFDYAGYRRGVNKTLGELGTLKAINEGVPKAQHKEFVENFIQVADENILRIADQYGKYITFQDNNVLSIGLQKLKRGINLGKDFGFGDMILKYPRTPGALLMRALEYSPAGFIRSGYILARPYYRKGTDPNQTEVMQALSRAIVGTFGLSGMGYYLYDVGIITGSSDKDRDLRDLEKGAGKGQYQVNLNALGRWAKSGFDRDQAKFQKGDRLITYDWAQPVAINISLGANVRKSILEGKDLKEGVSSFGVAAYKGVEGALDSLVEQSVLQGVKRAVEGYPGQTITDKITGVLADVPSSFVPTFSNQIRQYIDNAQRETYDPNPVKQAINRMKLRIPGLAGTLPQRYDTLGRPKETFQDSSNTLFNVFLNPSFTTKYKVSPEAKFVIDLISETGDKTAAPRVPGKNLTITRETGETETIKLTPEQYIEIQKIAGEETLKGIQMISEMDFTNEEKLRAMSRVLDRAGKTARNKIKDEMGVY